MSSTDWAYLAALTNNDFENGAHRTNFTPALSAVAATAVDVASYATQSAAYYEGGAAIYTLMLSVSGGALGVGYDQLDVPARNTLGDAAFANMAQIATRRVVTRDSTYQILPQDFWTDCIRVTSGTRTHTLPAWTDMPDFVPALPGKNRSGNNLTLAPTGSDTINGSASSITIATGSSYDIYKSDTSGDWEVRVYA